MFYISTRGQAPVLDFEGALLAGLARDGGLYLPEAWPVWPSERFDALVGKPYEEIALAIMRPFVGDAFDETNLAEDVNAAYAGFRHPARAPLVQVGPADWLLELHHGPTLAFKDFALQLVSRLFERALRRRGERVTIVGATSGDTGSAAIEAFRGLEAADVFVLYPHGRVSEVQRRQMTTPDEANVHALAVDGDFDDCQALVKAMFADAPFRDAMRLGAVNSINWARVLAQTVYYVSAALALGAPRRSIGFSVPTGNFGDVFAGYVAKRLGLPINRLVVATNVNDILHRTLETGRHERRGVTPTESPSMDIEVSSNFERLLFEIHDRDAGAVRALMAELKEGGFRLSQGRLHALRADFASARADAAETAAEIRRTREETGLIVDPHTAVGRVAARKLRGEGSAPMVTLATAHPAKFPDAVEAACGVRPPLPASLADLFRRSERFTRVPNDLAAVQSVIREKARR